MSFSVLSTAPGKKSGVPVFSDPYLFSQFPGPTLVSLLDPYPSRRLVSLCTSQRRLCSLRCSPVGPGGFTGVYRRCVPLRVRGGRTEVRWSSKSPRDLVSGGSSETGVTLVGSVDLYGLKSRPLATEVPLCQGSLGFRNLRVSQPKTPVRERTWGMKRNRGRKVSEPGLGTERGYGGYRSRLRFQGSP